MSYTVLARRYRSRDFDEIVGQEPIARTLQNAIASDRIAHAYLFCGTRGVGKTSMARIFAKAINASAELGEREAIANSILRGDDLDVIEIDGASNRGVNEARDLIAGAGLSPARCPYKVYIIDEVHMLTREAFNALLKTMEEPPAHVKFILCTTEPHKVPATIQSRCQRFDFRPLPMQQIAGQLSHVMQQEGVETTEDVITQIARLGNGSMRDALSILDRLLATGENPLSMQTVQDTLGLPDRTRVLQLVDAMAQGDAKAALVGGAALINNGASVEQVLEMLAEHFRDLMIIVTCCGESDLLDHAPAAIPQLVEQAAHFDAPGLVHMIALCDHAARVSRGSLTARAMLDALLVRLALSEHLADIPALLGRAPTDASHAASPSAQSKKKAPYRPERAVADREAPTVAAEAAREERMTEVKRPANPVAPIVETHEAAPAADTAEEIWRRVCEAELDRSGRRRVEMFQCTGGDATTIRLALTEKGEQSPAVCRSASYLDQLARQIETIVGRRIRVVVEPPSGDEAALTGLQGASETSIESLRNDPLVRRAVELFDGVITSVVPTRGTAVVPSEEGESRDV